MEYDVTTILREYFLHLDRPDDEHLFDVVETVDELARESPHEAWPLVRALIEIAPNDYALDYLAAGPLETLLIDHSDEIAPVIAADAAVNPAVQTALTYVILEPSDVLQRYLGQWLR